VTDGTSTSRRGAQRLTDTMCNLNRCVVAEPSYKGNRFNSTRRKCLIAQIGLLDPVQVKLIVIHMTSSPVRTPQRLSGPHANLLTLFVYDSPTNQRNSERPLLVR
jgi:hypothetical protein